MNEWSSPWDAPSPTAPESAPRPPPILEEPNGSNDHLNTAGSAKGTISLNFLSGYNDDAAWGTEENVTQESSSFPGPTTTNHIIVTRQNTAAPTFADVGDDVWRRSPEKENVGANDLVSTIQIQEEHDHILSPQPLRGDTTKTGINLLDGLESWNGDANDGIKQGSHEAGFDYFGDLPILKNESKDHEATNVNPSSLEGANQLEHIQHEPMDKPLDSIFGTEAMRTEDLASHSVAKSTSSMLQETHSRDAEERGGIVDGVGDHKIAARIYIPDNGEPSEVAENISQVFHAGFPSNSSLASTAIDDATANEVTIKTIDQSTPASVFPVQKDTAVDPGTGHQGLGTDQDIHAGTSSELEPRPVLITDESDDFEQFESSLKVEDRLPEDTGSGNAVLTESQVSHTSPSSPHDNAGLHFVVDKSLLQQLFTPNRDMPEPAEVAQRLIDSTSERKAWYHLSRQGSMHYYNSSDFDNYVRVTWPGSATRSKVTDIVSKWIADDRITGGAVFKARFKSTRRNSKVGGGRSTTTSVDDKNGTGLRSPSSIPKIASSPVGFGWNSLTPQSQTMALFPPPPGSGGIMKTARRVASNASMKSQAPQHPKDLSPEPRVSIERAGPADIQTAIPETVNNDTAAKDGDDDDFGNFMSSSPADGPFIQINKPGVTDETYNTVQKDNETIPTQISPTKDMLFDMPIFSSASTEKPTISSYEPNQQIMSTKTNDFDGFEDFFATAPPATTVPSAETVSPRLHAITNLPVAVAPSGSAQEPPVSGFDVLGATPIMVSTSTAAMTSSGGVSDHEPEDLTLEARLDAPLPPLPEAISDMKAEKEIEVDDEFDDWIGGPSPLAAQAEHNFAATPIAEQFVPIPAGMPQDSSIPTSTVGDGVGEGLESVSIAPAGVSAEEDLPVAEVDDFDDWSSAPVPLTNQSSTNAVDPVDDIFSTTPAPVGAPNDIIEGADYTNGMTPSSQTRDGSATKAYDFPDLGDWFGSAPARSVSQPTSTLQSTIIPTPVLGKVDETNSNNSINPASTLKLSVAQPPRPATAGLLPPPSNRPASRSPLSQSQNLDNLFNLEALSAGPVSQPPSIPRLANGVHLSNNHFDPSATLPAPESSSTLNVLADEDDFDDFGTFVTSPQLSTPASQHLPGKSTSREMDASNDDYRFGAWATDEFPKPQAAPHTPNTWQSFPSQPPTQPVNTTKLAQAEDDADDWSWGANTGAPTPMVESLKAQAPNASPPNSTNKQGNGDSKREQIDDDVVRKIVQGLPDWSYML